MDTSKGDERAAILFAVGANVSHGLRRTNEDKREATRTLLRDSIWSEWNNSEIARRCNVSDDLVKTIIDDEPEFKHIKDRKTKLEIRDGKTRETKRTEKNRSKSKPEKHVQADEAAGQEGSVPMLDTSSPPKPSEHNTDSQPPTISAKTGSQSGSRNTDIDKMATVAWDLKDMLDSQLCIGMQQQISPNTIDALDNLAISLEVFRQKFLASNGGGAE